MGDYKPFDAGSIDASGGDNEPENANQPAAFLGGSGDSGEQFNPAIHSGPDKRNVDGSYRRKRGRKPGSSNSASSGNKRQADNSANIETLTSLLVIVHSGLASATRTPELALESDDANALAKASAAVLVEFDITPNPKVQAVVGLVMTAGAVYGPKIYMIKERRKEQRVANEQPIQFNRGYSQ